MGARPTILRRRIEDGIVYKLTDVEKGYSVGRYSKEHVRDIVTRAIWWGIRHNSPMVLSLCRRFVINAMPKLFPRYVRKIYRMGGKVEIPDDSGYWDWLWALMVGTRFPDTDEDVLNVSTEFIKIYLDVFESDKELMYDEEALSSGLDALWVLKATGRIEAEAFDHYIDVFRGASGLGKLDRFRLMGDVSGLSMVKLYAEPKIWLNFLDL